MANFKQCQNSDSLLDREQAVSSQGCWEGGEEIEQKIKKKKREREKPQRHRQQSGACQGGGGGGCRGVNGDGRRLDSGGEHTIQYADGGM